MTKKRYAVVITTINVPRLLPAYLADFAEHGHEGASCIIVADENTPAEAEAYCRALAGGPVAVEYLTVEWQKTWLRRFPELDRLLPYRSIQRRNIGYLVAWERGADVIVSMDDDNFLHDTDYLGGHSLTGEMASVPCVTSDDGWFNVCSMLATEPQRRFYHRGFPLSKRWKPSTVTRSFQARRVAVNAGLWLADPDVDTITRAEEPFTVTGLAGDVSYLSLVQGTWSPFNSQSTAAIRDLLPFLYLIVAGDALSGYRSSFRNFRYDDIWMSYFARAAIDQMGDMVTYGRPLVVQHRNPHDLLTDIDRELVPMFLTEALVEMLRAIELRETSYPALHAELIEGLRAAVSARASLDPRERAFLLDVVEGMAVWGRVCATLAG